jgi:hypothetical protein
MLIQRVSFGAFDACALRYWYRVCSKMGLIYPKIRWRILNIFVFVHVHLDMVILNDLGSTRCFQTHRYDPISVEMRIDAQSGSLAFPHCWVLLGPEDPKMRLVVGGWKSWRSQRCKKLPVHRGKMRAQELFSVASVVALPEMHHPVRSNGHRFWARIAIWCRYITTSTVTMYCTVLIYWRVWLIFLTILGLFNTGSTKVPQFWAVSNTTGFTFWGWLRQTALPYLWYLMWYRNARSSQFRIGTSSSKSR